jgi:hypothetical protein
VRADLRGTDPSGPDAGSTGDDFCVTGTRPVPAKSPKRLTTRAPRRTEASPF